LPDFLFGDPMPYSAKILADSISSVGVRLTTMEVTFPRIVLAEFNTHRMFSRNSASSRAIPIEKMLQRIESDPFVPTYWGANQKGMQAEQELGDKERRVADALWRCAADDAVMNARRLKDLGVHKQLVNRLVEPFMWHTVIVTATDWENFFNLRTHKDAQPEIREIAQRMKELYTSSTPKLAKVHLPLVDDLEDLLYEGYSHSHIARISSARCARVSYLTHEGKRDTKADLELATRLQTSGHMSPFEHVAFPLADPETYVGNFRGWHQYRKDLEGENVFCP
jgi:thymidylate synthase ThyX